MQHYVVHESWNYDALKGNRKSWVRQGCEVHRRKLYPEMDQFSGSRADWRDPL